MTRVLVHSEVNMGLKLGASTKRNWETAFLAVLILSGILDSVWAFALIIYPDSHMQPAFLVGLAVFVTAFVGLQFVARAQPPSPKAHVNDLESLLYYRAMLRKLNLEYQRQEEEALMDERRLPKSRRRFYRLSYRGKLWIERLSRLYTRYSKKWSPKMAYVRKYVRVHAKLMRRRVGRLSYGGLFTGILAIVIVVALVILSDKAFWGIVAWFNAFSIPHWSQIPAWVWVGTAILLVLWFLRNSAGRQRALGAVSGFSIGKAIGTLIILALIVCLGYGGYKWLTSKPTIVYGSAGEQSVVTA